MRVRERMFCFAFKKQGMKQFALIFRMDITSAEARPSKEQMELYMEQWATWIDELSSRQRLVGGHHFSPEGRTLRAGQVVANDPYTENRESVAGYIIILAEHIDDAVLVAERCPILQGKGTSVEVRETANPGA